MVEEQPPAARQPAATPRVDEQGEIHYPDGRIEHPGVHYEPTDIRFGWILALLLVVCCIAALHYYVVWRFYWYQEGSQLATNESPYPLAPTISQQQTPPLPPEPRLEQVAHLAGEPDVFEQLSAKEKVLHSYGTTAEKGFVHVPIEQAIKHLAGQLPGRTPSAARSASEADKEGNGLLDAGESNSGRVFRGALP